MKNEPQFPSKYFGKTKDTLSSEHYDRYLLSKNKRRLVQYIKQLPKNAHVLDAGCGSGKTIRIIQAYRPDLRISAMDISNVGELMPKGVEFKVASTEELEQAYGKNAFDAIICQHVLEHLLYPIKTMESFKAILKDQGTLYIELPNWARILVPWSDKFFWNDYTHVRIFSKQTIQRMMKDYEFSIDWMRTLSSGNLVEANDSIKRVKAFKQKQKTGIFRLVAKILRAGFVRLSNLLTKDILIVIATNHK